MKRTWRIATATKTGTYHAIGARWGRLLQERFDWDVEIINTAGSIPNIQLISKGEADFGLAATAALHEAWTGTGWAKDGRCDRIRGLFSAYGSFMHGWTFLPDLPGIEELSGKRVTIGPPGGTSAEYVARILRLLGITPAEILNVDWAEGNRLLCSDQADAGVTIVGPPQPSVVALLGSGRLRLLGFREQSIKRITEELPFFAPALMPPATYPGQGRSIGTVSIWNLVFCRKNLPEETIYQVTKESIGNKELLREAHEAAGQIRGDDVDRFPIPLHPGSFRYHREAGYLRDEESTGTG